MNQHRTGRGMSRRALLRGGAVLGGGLVAGLAGGGLPALARPAAPPLVRSGLPSLTHGVQSGDVTTRGAVVWARADRPARMLVQVSDTEAFRRSRWVRGPVVTPATDLTGTVDLRGLPDGQDVHYRVAFADPDRLDAVGESQQGSFRTAPRRATDVSFTWSGDTAGQGYGINPEFGGMRIYEAMRQARPDFFVHSGDTVYADGPLSSTVTAPDGSTWRNVTTEAKSKVAETLDEFRGNHAYNLLDENVRRFNAEVPLLAQWDDHEVTNNWYPGEVLTDPRYVVRDVNTLRDRAFQAFHEYMPIRDTPQEPRRVYRTISYGPLLEVFVIDLRTYRGPNTTNRQPQRSEETAILGARQLAWLERELAASPAVWKVIASDLPVGLVVPDGAQFEGIANADGGAALGRELEIAALLSTIKRRRVRNVVWCTADVHYTAAHHYDPSRAAFEDFDPFWEFVSGPLNAGSFGPNSLDATFGPEVRYVRAAPVPNSAPSAGYQFFGNARIDADSGVMTVALKDLDGATLYSVDLVPEH